MTRPEPSENTLSDRLHDGFADAANNSATNQQVRRLVSNVASVSHQQVRQPDSRPQAGLQPNLNNQLYPTKQNEQMSQQAAQAKKNVNLKARYGRSQRRSQNKHLSKQKIAARRSVHGSTGPPGAGSTYAAFSKSINNLNQGPGMTHSTVGSGVTLSDALHPMQNQTVGGAAASATHAHFHTLN